MQSTFIVDQAPYVEQAIYCVVFLSALGSALAGGVFFAFSNFVMAALNHLPPADAIAAMNAINVKAINPWFMALLFGTGLLCVFDIVVALRHWPPVGPGLILAGAILYIVSGLAVTMRFNVPLNVALAKLAAGSGNSDEWSRYRRSWTRWNHVRTIGCAVAAALIIQGLASGQLWLFILKLLA